MDTRRQRSSTTVEAPSSWGSSFLNKKPPSPSHSPLLSSSPGIGASRSGSFSLAHHPTSAPPHRRSPSNVDVLVTPPPPSSTSSLKTFLTSSNPSTPSVPAPVPALVSSTSSASLLGPPRHSLPPSAFAQANPAVPQLNTKPTSKTRAFAQTLVDFIRSPRGGSSSKPVPSAAPNPYLNLHTNMDTAVFGVALEVAVQRSNHIHPLLPDVVYKCFLYLMVSGPMEEGIFRLTGSVNDIKKIRDAFDAGGDYDIASVLNPHTVAGVLKLFIRELPQQLFPVSWAWSESRPLQELHDFMDDLPAPNRCFLSCLIKLLGLISKASEVTKMGVPNLVIVFSAALQCTGSFLTHLMHNASELFPIDDLYQTRQKIEVDKKLAEEKEGEKDKFQETESENVEAEVESNDSKTVVVRQEGIEDEGENSGEEDSGKLIVDKEDDGKSKKGKKKEKEHGHTKKGKRKTEKGDKDKDGADKKKEKPEKHGHEKQEKHEKHEKNEKNEKHEKQDRHDRHDRDQKKNKGEQDNTPLFAHEEDEPGKDGKNGNRREEKGHNNLKKSKSERMDGFEVRKETKEGTSKRKGKGEGNEDSDDTILLKPHKIQSSKEEAKQEEIQKEDKKVEERKVEEVRLEEMIPEETKIEETEIEETKTEEKKIEEKKLVEKKEEKTEEKKQHKNEDEDIFKEEGRVVSYLNLLPDGQKDKLGSVAAKFTKGDKRRVKKRIQTIFDSDDEDESVDGELLG